MKQIIIILLTVVFGILTISKGIETIVNIFNLEIVSALIHAFVTYCGYLLTCVFAKKI